MIKVITYGTFDLLHHGHIRLLQRAKTLGDYLIVGITSDDFDKRRGKINGQQSLTERIDAVRATGLADEILVEEYEGQKIHDVIEKNINVFTVGSDWEGKFDYLNQYCTVKYLPRTSGISSSEIRSQEQDLHVGIIGDSPLIAKYFTESLKINGLRITSFFSYDCSKYFDSIENKVVSFTNLDAFLGSVDAVIILTHPDNHYQQTKACLLSHKHVLCESPVALNASECRELYKIAEQNNVFLFDSIKTAYSTAFDRLVLLAKGGIIGDILSINSTCTSLKESSIFSDDEKNKRWNSICTWGPTALYPILNILGTRNSNFSIVTKLENSNNLRVFDLFTEINLIFKSAVASAFVGKGVKSEGQLIISGTNGYIFVPAPWWKCDYFEIRYEDPRNNKRYFFQLNGEGINNELINFAKSIRLNKSLSLVSPDVSIGIAFLISCFYNKTNLTII